MTHIRNLFVPALAFLLLAACHGKGGPQKEESAATVVPVIIQETQPRDLHQYVSITGTLEGITDITMSSETSGRVVELYKKLGDWVDAGQAIGRVEGESRRIQADQAQAALLAAEAGLEAAQRSWTASEELYARKTISEAEYSQAKSAFKQAQAACNGAQANLDEANKALEHSRFVAPVSGYITSLSLEVGQTVSSGAQVCVLVNPRKLLIKTGVGESAIAGLHVGEKVAISHPSLSAPAEGRITGIGIKPLAGTANYPIEIPLDNPGEKLMPGMVVEGSIESQAIKDVIYVPRDAILEEMTGTFVFVVRPGDTAEHRAVTLGRQIDDQVIVKEGLNPGDKLVVEGMDNLQEGTSVTIRQGARQ